MNKKELDKKLRLIAFYLPQFHPIPENDKWWGKGFTEWTNVKKAKPLFVGHYQPHIPTGDLGYYDLRDPKVREKQAKMAEEYGIFGFCYYHFWFNGKKLLETPLQEVLKSGKPDFPFCVCWANENWTRKWDGGNEEILSQQDYSEEDAKNFIKDLIPAFRDKRYIQVDGKPLLVVYRTELFPDMKKTADIWRSVMKKEGFSGIYLARVERFTFGEDPAAIGFDAAIEFAPDISDSKKIILDDDSVINKVNNDKQKISAAYDYKVVAEKMLAKEKPAHKLFRGVFPFWDNTARRGSDGMLFLGASPKKFQYFLKKQLEYTRDNFAGDERMVFVNAWNEWGEGCHLEPDQKNGFKYLEACAAAVAEISVIIPSYNHAKYIDAAIRSVLGQTFKKWELIIIDDGSIDDSVKIIKKYDDPRIRLFRQSNHDAPYAINRGIKRAKSEYIAILNSDDTFKPLKLEKSLAMLKDGYDFVFGKLDVIDKNGKPFDDGSESVRRMHDVLNDSVGKQNDLNRLLLNMNYYMTTSNFVFRRDAVKKAGYFHEKLHYAHDMDFLTRIFEKGLKVGFVPEYLGSYRIHPDNTISKGGAEKYLETCYSIAKLFKKNSPILKTLTPDFFKQYIVVQTVLILLSFSENEIEKIISDREDANRKTILGFIDQLEKTSKSFNFKNLLKLQRRMDRNKLKMILKK